MKGAKKFARREIRKFQAFSTEKNPFGKRKTSRRRKANTAEIIEQGHSRGHDDSLLLAPTITSKDSK